MNKLILLLLLSTTASADNSYFQFVHERFTGNIGDIPNTSVEYDYADHNAGIQTFINTTKMTLSSEGKPDQWLFGWSIHGIPASYEYWNLTEAGDYTITLEVEIEHNTDSPPWCNVSSDCYVVDPDSWTELFTDTLIVTVLAPIQPVIPEIVPVIEPVIASEPVLEDAPVVIDVTEPNPVEDEIEADDKSQSGGLSLWLLGIMLIVRRLTHATVKLHMDMV